MEVLPIFSKGMLVISNQYVPLRGKGLVNETSHI